MWETYYKDVPLFIKGFGIGYRYRIEGVSDYLSVSQFLEKQLPGTIILLFLLRKKIV